MSERLRHPLYRCYYCGYLLTRHEMIAKWETAERTDSKDASLCPCGSRTVRATNPKWWEELFLPRVWKEAWLLHRSA